jgi:hypothetical protein
MARLTPEEKKARRARRREALVRVVRLPMVSGKASAFVLGLCLAVSAGVVLAVAYRSEMPTWVRLEVVLAIWWVIWVIALTQLLYVGKRVSDDHAMGQPRNWFGSFFGTSSGGSWGDLGLAGAEGCGEGCATVMGVLVAAFVALLAFWLLIEFVIPALAFVLYFLVRGMLARVANDDHGCTGRFGQALAWGAVWATVYTAPPAVLVWVGHLIHLRQGAG